MGAPARWVENNTLYSTKLPSVEITVSEQLPYKGDQKTDQIAESIRGNNRTGQDIEFYHFVNNNRDKRLNIKIATLTAHKGWYMIPPDYSKRDKVFDSGNEKINGFDFVTGIFATEKNGKIALVKAFGKVVGETTRYQLFYIERVDRSWLNKYPDLLSVEERDTIAEFNNRANGNFTIGSYQGTPPPGTM